MAKIKDRHYEYLKAQIALVWTLEKHNAHKQFIINEGKAKDVEKRLRFDWAYYAKVNRWVCDNIYKYANDTHLNTAYKSIITELSKG